jgi:hypothetical protein
LALLTPLLALLTGCGVSKMLPGPPVLTTAERAGWDAPSPAVVRYDGPAEGPPILPLQVWGLQYALDVVLVSRHPDWSMHEYARVDLPSGPLWLAKDADAQGNQGIVADLPDIEAWLPEVPAPRRSGRLEVTDRSTATEADLRFAYTNLAGEPVEVTYKGPMPTQPSKPRNGNTMGHSRSAVAVLLDLHLFRPGGEATVRIGGKEWGIQRMLGLYPLKFLLAQTQVGFAVTDLRATATEGGFTVTRPGTDGPWPTRSQEAWTVEGDWVRRDNPVTTLAYHFSAGELDRAEVRQVGVDGPIATFVFRPALPDLRRPFQGTVESGFVIDVAGQPAHGKGRVRVTGGASPVVEMIPEEPRWFADRPMRTTIERLPDGYHMRTVRTD